MSFKIIRNDITKVKADAIVNTANPSVAIGDGVDSAIYEAAGRERLLEARKQIGILDPGEIGITSAFDLDAKYIIHVSGPWWQGGEHGEAEILRKCYDKALAIAKENGCASIAFPLLATGSYGFPQKLGIQIAVDAFTAFLEEYEMEITLVVFGSSSVHISGELVDEVTSYIDDVYVEGALAKEYSHDGVPWTGDTNYHMVESLSTVALDSAIPDFLKKSDAELGSLPDEGISYEEEEKSGSPERIESTEIKIPSFLKNRRKRESAIPTAPQIDAVATSAMAAKPSPTPKPESLDNVLKGIYKDSFEKHLQQLINKKGLKNSEVYAAANISKQYFSKLLKGQVKPSKEKVLALAVGLRLNMDEAVDFLRIAGYALSPVSQTDAVVEYFIEHEDYNVLKIDIVLFDYGLDPLSNAK